MDETNVLAYTPREVLEKGLLPGSRAWLYARLRDGSLPSIRCGRKLLIPKRALEKLLDSGSAERRA